MLKGKLNLFLYYVRDKKEDGIINMIWIAGWDNGAYLFTKNYDNLDQHSINRHGSVNFGKDEYEKYTTYPRKHSILAF